MSVPADDAALETLLDGCTLTGTAFLRAETFKDRLQSFDLGFQFRVAIGLVGRFLVNNLIPARYIKS